MAIGLKQTYLLIALVLGFQAYGAGENEVRDSLVSPKNLKDFFERGHWGGHIRNHFMYTNHTGPFNSQFANATGMKVHFTTANFKGFEFGLAGIFTFNTGSSEIEEIDPYAGRRPVFEEQLFDITHPGNKHDMDRLEELFVKYNFGESWVYLGRHELNSPLVNPADGRMKPYSFQGFGLHFNDLENLSLEAHWITHVSPRSTVEWCSLEESIGLYGQGFKPSGEPSYYHGSLRSNGMGIFALHRDIHSNIRIDAYWYYVENMMNTAYVKVAYSGKDNTGIYGGLEFLKQAKTGSGGSDNDDLAYFEEGEGNYLLGARMGYKYRKTDLNINALLIGDKGRFLFPREWGREQFFATIPRGRIEGTGNGFLFDIGIKQKLDDHFTAACDMAYFNGPGSGNLEYNKYALADYHQVNCEIDYNFSGTLDGLELKFLYVHKSALEEVEPSLLYYQANFNHFNLIANLNF